MLEKECDEILQFLVDKPLYLVDRNYKWNYSTLKENFKHINNIDFENAIFKLYSDSYIETDNNRIPTSAVAPIITIVLSSSGKFFITSDIGGYQNRLNHQNAESIRVDALELRQKAYEYRMTYLTVILAVGTFLLALADWVRLLIEHNPFSCR